MRRSRSVALLLALCVACDTPTGPAFPRVTAPLSPPIQYATWWNMVEACSGLHGDMNAVTWSVAADEPIVTGGQSYDGLWSSDGNRIVLGHGMEGDGRVVRHEMLHALLQRGDHPVEYFVNRCGPLAPCRGACDNNEAHRGVPPDARVVPTDSLQVSLTLSPNGAPAVSIDSGWVTLMVTATNTRAEPVWVEMWDDVSFGYVFKSTPGTLDWAGDSLWAFRAGESRSLAFDVQLPAGMADTLWGFFGRRNSRPRFIVVQP